MIFKNKKSMVLICSIIATIIILAIAVPRIKQNITGDLETVYKLQNNLEIGQKIIEDNLKEEQVSKLYIPKDAVKDKKDIVGKYVKTDVYKYDYITKEKLANKEEDIYYDGKSNMIAITLHSQPSGISGQLQRGDVVQVLGYKNDNLGEDTVLKNPVLNAVEVVSVTTSNLKDIDKNIREKEDTAPSDLPSTVVFKIINDKQSEELVKLEYGSKMHLVFLGRGEQGKKLLEAQANSIKSLESEPEVQEVKSNITNLTLESGEM